MRQFAVALTFVVLGACSNTPVSEASNEAQVDPRTFAGDVRGVTGEVERIPQMASEFVSPRDVEIWLPPSYATSPDKRYPVLYMHDGQNLFDPKQSKYSGWDWGVDEAMTALIARDLLPEAIIVGPHSLEATRNQDYFPEKAGHKYAKDFVRSFKEFDPDTLNGDNYIRFLTEELKPYVDDNYRTKADKDNTFVMGSSMGGLISLYAIAERPDIFGAAGMVSTHFPLADGVLVDYFAEVLPDPNTHRLYFDYGTETLDHNYEGYQTRMDAAIEAAGYVRGENWTTRKYQGHDHSERAWRNRVHVPLQFILAGQNVEGGEEK